MREELRGEKVWVLRGKREREVREIQTFNRCMEWKEKDERYEEKRGRRVTEEDNERKGRWR